VAHEGDLARARPTDHQRVIHDTLRELRESVGERITDGLLVPRLGWDVDQPGEGVGELFHDLES
jgi:hypothetical protein